jgi:RNA polymerase sigma-70 factor (ECF subfamily)
MVRNLALDRHRMKVNQTENIDGMDFISSSSVEHSLEQDERINTIRNAMEQLPEKQRVAMQLRDFEGYSYKEIAEVMEITEDQVKVNIFRARQSIRSTLAL